MIMAEIEGKIRRGQPTYYLKPIHKHFNTFNKDNESHKAHLFYLVPRKTLIDSGAYNIPVYRYLVYME